MDHSILSTPPIRANMVRRSSSDDAEDSFEDAYGESYFSKTYVPLSNLPTPPPSSHSDCSPRKSSYAFGLDGSCDPALLGPAIHLKNLIPSAVSLTDPSCRVVHTLLARANLPLPTVALAVCILDSLNSRFALSWRRAYPLACSESSASERLHIDSVRPEVIVFAALIIALKFLNDLEIRTRVIAERWGDGQWTCEQINYTQQCVMENLGYRIMPLWTTKLIYDALEDMETAGRNASGTTREHTLGTEVKLIPSIYSNPAGWTEHLLTPPEK